MKPLYWVALAVGAAVLLGFWFMWDSTGTTSVAKLAAKASNGEKLEDRRSAAMELTMRDSPEVLPQLRHLVKESKDPEVITIALAGVAAARDREDLSLFLSNLEHPNNKVREAAGTGLFQYL